MRRIGVVVAAAGAALAVATGASAGVPDDPYAVSIVPEYETTALLSVGDTVPSS